MRLPGWAGALVVLHKASYQKTVSHNSSAGAVSLYVAIVFVVFMLMTGLVSDGAEIRQTRRRLDDMAARISREAAQQIDTAELHKSGKVTLDISKAKAVGKRLITRLGLIGEVEATKERVVVTLSETVKPSLSVIPSSLVSSKREAAAVSAQRARESNS